MATITLSTNVSIGGVSISGPTRREGSGQIGHTVTLAAAKTGTLSTRTSDTAGTLTMAEGHGFSDADVIDIYWEGGVAYGATVGTVAGNSVPFTGASGAALPVEDSAITAQVRTEIDTDFDGDKVEIVAAVSTRRGHIEFRESAASAHATELPAGEPWIFASGQGTNPLAEDVVDDAHVSNGDATQTAIVRIGVLYNSDS